MQKANNTISRIFQTSVDMKDPKKVNRPLTRSQRERNKSAIRHIRYLSTFSLILIPKKMQKMITEAQREYVAFAKTYKEYTTRLSELANQNR